MTLYLKYRPKNLDELDLQDVGVSLKKIINSGNIPHAFLFAGPKGTGKTSAARIVAKIINCEHLSADGVPCNECKNCVSVDRGNNLDVIEMDAASHRGIEDIRTLREAVKLAPTGSNKKIYIIDEAHMLTTEASNALLKTLEEPPNHVIFILATTNPEKLIDTIRSRTTLIAFRKANDTEIIRALKRVADGEKIKIGEEDVARIVEISAGAFRDAIKLLEQFSLEGAGYLEKYRNADLAEFLHALINKSEKAGIAAIEKNIASGINPDKFIKDLLDLFHKALLAEVGLGDSVIKGLSKSDLLELTELFTQALIQIPDSPVEVLPLEIAVVKWSQKQNTNLEEASQNSMQDAKPSKVPIKKDEAAPAIEAISKLDTKIQNADFINLDDSIWKNILLAIRPINASIEGLLRASKPINFDGKTLTLGVYYKFHKERLEEGRHRKILEEVLAKVLNNPTRVVCNLVEPPPKQIFSESENKTVLTEGHDKDIIKAAEEIFGS